MNAFLVRNLAFFPCEHAKIDLFQVHCQPYSPGSFEELELDICPEYGPVFLSFLKQCREIKEHRVQLYEHKPRAAKTIHVISEQRPNDFDFPRTNTAIKVHQWRRDGFAGSLPQVWKRRDLAVEVTQDGKAQMVLAGEARKRKANRIFLNGDEFTLFQYSPANVGHLVLLRNVTETYLFLRVKFVKAQMIPDVVCRNTMNNVCPTLFKKACWIKLLFYNDAQSRDML